MEEKYTIAMMIDSENLSADYYGLLASELQKIGNLTVKRVYGDFTSDYSKKWNKIIVDESLTPVQVYAPTKKKNATDIFVVIDTMDLLNNSPHVDAFCLATSDSDFIRLALRLKEAGKFVIGAGISAVTAGRWVKACDKFILLDSIEETSEKRAAGKIKPGGAAVRPEINFPVTDRAGAAVTDTDAGLGETMVSIPEKQTVFELAQSIISEQCDDDGEMHISALMNELHKVYPFFDSRLYGIGKASEFFKAPPFKISMNKRKGTMVVSLV